MDDIETGVCESIITEAFARAFCNLCPSNPEDDQLGEMRLNDLQRQHVLAAMMDAHNATRRKLEESMPLVPSQQMALASAILISLSDALAEIDGVIDFGPEFRQILDDMRNERGIR